jgi:hypothetical protein
MKIAVIVEGRSESEAFKPALVHYLRSKGCTVRLDFKPQHKGLPKEQKLKRTVENFIAQHGYDHVIALTDVYTISNTTIFRDFKDASDAKEKMKAWVGENSLFQPHAATYCFEAWLLPFKEKIEKLTKTTFKKYEHPETVNHNKPPHLVLNEHYRKSLKRSYAKVEDAKHILTRSDGTPEDLQIAIDKCPELKAFVDTILTLCKEKR